MLKMLKVLWRVLFWVLFVIGLVFGARDLWRWVGAAGDKEIAAQAPRTGGHK